MAADEAFADYAPPVDGDIFASISDVFTCPVCGGSGHREPPNGIDDVRCYQCGGSGSVRVISTHYLEWLIEQVAWCDDVCEKDRAIADRAREELARLEARMADLKEQHNECTSLSEKSRIARLMLNTQERLLQTKRIIDGEAPQ